MLCDVCGKLSISEDGRADGFPLYTPTTHHETCASFRDSVSRGCYICTTLWRALSPDEQRIVFDSAEMEMNEEPVVAGRFHLETQDRALTVARFESAGWWDFPNARLLHVNCNTINRLSSLVNPYQHTTFVLQPFHKPQSADFVEIKSTSTKSTETLSLAKSWVEDCATNHQQCNANARTETWYPTRLIDCGSIGIPEADCRLVESDGAGLRGSYMTLSHCWGTADCLKLTKNNYAQMMEIIPSKTLPQLYQDAVYITRMLGVKYLWIDSLCIIQEGDEQNDWAKEVRDMGNIYSNSYCTISAANAPNGHHSMFCYRRLETMSPQVAQFSIDGHTSSCLLSDLQTWKRQVSCALINTRGWVLQERILSPRILYFGERQISWECHRQDKCETYPSGRVGVMSLFSHRLKTDRSLVGDVNEGDPTVYLWWRWTVSAYTTCQLSFPIDKLAAISAVAKATSQVLKDEYVVGMWRRDLEYELLWSVEKNPTILATRPAVYRAPTWSWMAVDGKIYACARFPNDAARLLFDVVHVELDYLTDDHTGTVRGGYLQLRGTLKQMMLVESRHASGKAVWSMHIDGDLIGETDDSGYTWPLLQLDPPYNDSTWQSKGNVLYCMLGKLQTGRQRTNDMINMLILEVTDEKNGVYRRVGLAWVQGGDVRKKMLRLSQKADSIPCEEYSDSKHLIRVI